MDLANLCTDVVGGKLMLGANGRACDLEIEFDDQKKQRYRLRSPALNERYYSNDPENREGLIQYLNRTQSFRVVPESSG